MGRISSIEDDVVVLKVSSQVELRLQRFSVQVVLPKGTLKGL